jgi:hypothetical protein
MERCLYLQHPQGRMERTKDTNKDLKMIVILLSVITSM